MFWIIVIVGFIIAIPTIMRFQGYNTPTGDFDNGVRAYNIGDYKTARMEFTYLADQGDAEAQYYVGIIYENGYDSPPNYQRALKWYRRAADQGHEGARAKLR